MILNINVSTRNSPLQRAINQQSAEWLETSCPLIYDALVQEIDGGRTLHDIRQIMRRTFGYEIRDNFVLRIIQAAEWMLGEQVQI